jgi:uncharacterized protein with GYD domain
MTRFLVDHRHDAEECPASNEGMAKGLSDHMEPESAARQDVALLAECVVPGEHHLIAIVEAEDEARVASFFQPFNQVGTVSITQVKTCRNVAEDLAD